MHHGTAVAKCKVFRDDLGAKTKTLYEKEFVKLRDVTMGQKPRIDTSAPQGNAMNEAPDIDTTGFQGL